MSRQGDQISPQQETAAPRDFKKVKGVVSDHDSDDDGDGMMMEKVMMGRVVMMMMIIIIMTMTGGKILRLQARRWGVLCRRVGARLVHCRQPRLVGPRLGLPRVPEGGFPSKVVQMIGKRELNRFLGPIVHDRPERTRRERGARPGHVFYALEP